MAIKITSRDIEVVIAKRFGYRTNVIVPNVSWGFGLNHECDMLILSNAGYLTEIEIKVSKSDLKADLLKSHKHQSRQIKSLYFAYPESMSDCDEFVPKEAGIFHIYENTWMSGGVMQNFGLASRLIRPCVNRKRTEKISDSKKMELMRLGCMRIWSLKERLSVVQNEAKKR